MKVNIIHKALFLLKNCNNLQGTKACLLFIAALFLHTIIFSQTVAEEKNITDTNQILSILDKGKILREKSPAESFQYLNTALQSSRAINFDRGTALSLAAFARWYFGNDVNKSIVFGREALQIFENNNWSSIDNTADVHLLLAESYDELGKKDSSAYYYYLLGAEVENGNLIDPEFAVVIFTKLAVFWINLEEGPSILDENKKIIKRFVDKAKRASLKIKDTADGRSSIYFIEGAYYHSLQNYDSARYFYNIYLQSREQLGKLNVTRKVSTLFNIADTYLQQKNATQSLKYINLIKKIGEEPKNKEYLAFYMSFVDLVVANIYFQQKNYQACITLLDKTLPALKLTGNHLRNEVVQAYNVYADAYAGLGNFEKALDYKNIYIGLQDSLTKKDKIEMISRLEIRNRMAEKDKELALQKLTLNEVKSKVKDKNFWIAAISLLTLSGILIFALWRKRNRSKQVLQQERIDNLQHKIKIERLKASITGEERERTRIARELHDGIGGLLSVARMNFELAKKTNHNKENVDFIDGIKLLEEATDELRKAAYNLMPEVLLNQGLASAVQAYCEKMTSKGRTEISFQAIGNRKDVTSFFDLPVYRIIQELVHNVIKHAHAAHALVQINFQDDGNINITVEDDGIGIAVDANNVNLGMGLRNLKERVNDLGGKLDIQSTAETGTSIYLEFDSLQEKKL